MKIRKGQLAEYDSFTSKSTEADGEETDKANRLFKGSTASLILLFRYQHLPSSHDIIVTSGCTLQLK